VTTTALANLFIAVAEMDNVCLVVSDLAGSNYSGGQAALEAAFNRATQGITAEARRIAVPITPVNPERRRALPHPAQASVRDGCARAGNQESRRGLP
jgi:hypothetical protein